MANKKPLIDATGKRFTAWSYSRYRDYMDCPRKALLKHLMKKDFPVTTPKGPALVRGEIIHKEAENYLTGKVRALSVNLKRFKKQFAELRKAKAVAEGKWAMTVKWQPIDFFDWAGAWCRLVLDAHYRPKPTVARVIDFKTGKIYANNSEQMELYALGALAHYPMVTTIKTELWYTDQDGDNINGDTFTRSQVLKLQKSWRLKVIPMLSDTKFIPRPSAHACQYCDYSKRKNGPCEF